MKPATMTPEEIRLAGLDALARELGPVGMVCFLQQFETGYGDYTRERREWLADRDVQAVATNIARRRKRTIP